ncbi:MAG: hypothetical protein GY696_35515 [Gammaproteobacteria bacterium]|nr:hypothetical protein [Gammaproteobacteria bacterium]
MGGNHAPSILAARARPPASRWDKGEGHKGPDGQRVGQLDRGPGLAGLILVAFTPEVNPESPGIRGLCLGWRVQESRG